MTSRRARTRELIELGALLQASGLVELSGGDRPLLSQYLSDFARELQQRRNAPAERTG